MQIKDNWNIDDIADMARTFELFLLHFVRCVTVTVSPNQIIIIIIIIIEVKAGEPCLLGAGIVSKFIISKFVL